MCGLLKSSDLCLWRASGQEDVPKDRGAGGQWEPGSRGASLVFWAFVSGGAGPWWVRRAAAPQLLLDLLIATKVTKSESPQCPTLCDPMDYAVHGILQAKILECVPVPSPGDLPNPGIEPRSPILQVDS